MTICYMIQKKRISLYKNYYRCNRKTKNYKEKGGGFKPEKKNYE